MHHATVGNLAVAILKFDQDNEISITIESIKKTDGLRKANNAPCSRQLFGVVAPTSAEHHLPQLAFDQRNPRIDKSSFLALFAPSHRRSLTEASTVQMRTQPEL
jgi:hypothetical protein